MRVLVCLVCTCMHTHSNKISKRINTEEGKLDILSSSSNIISSLNSYSNNRYDEYTPKTICAYSNCSYTCYILYVRNYAKGYPLTAGIFFYSTASLRTLSLSVFWRFSNVYQSKGSLSLCMWKKLDEKWICSSNMKCYRVTFERVFIGNRIIHIVLAFHVTHVTTIRTNNSRGTRVEIISIYQHGRQLPVFAPQDARGCHQ